MGVEEPETVRRGKTVGEREGFHADEHLDAGGEGLLEGRQRGLV